MSILEPETVLNSAESLGLSLKEGAVTALLADVEYRVREIIHESKKFMIHGKRRTLTTEDVANALRVKNVEPIYGYTNSAPLKFKSTHTGTQKLYYLDDQDVDLEDLIYAPLPPVPLDISITAHWLAVEGVQPAIVQNPSPADLKEMLHEKAAKSASAQATGAGEPPIISGPDAIVNSEILVRDVLSKELQLYFEKITETIQSDDPGLQTLAVVSLEEDTGIQPLMPYFVQHITHTISKNVREGKILWAMMRMTNALLKNKNLFIEPYLHQIIPDILTCLVTKRINPPQTNANPSATSSSSSAQASNTPQLSDHHALRDFASTLLSHVCIVHGKSYPTLQPRVTRTLLRAFLDPSKSLATRYGAVIGIAGLGAEAVKVLVRPNIGVMAEALQKEEVQRKRKDPGNEEKPKKFGTVDAKKLYVAVVGVLADLVFKDLQAHTEVISVDGEGLNTHEMYALLVQTQEELCQSLGFFARDVLQKVENKLKGVPDQYDVDEPDSEDEEDQDLEMHEETAMSF